MMTATRRTVLFLLINHLGGRLLIANSLSTATLPFVPTQAATTTTTTTSKKNPRYADFPLDNYLANPYFHKINTDYPGLQLVHEEPYIFLVNDFFTNDECDRLIHKALGDELRPQVGGGSVERTSSGIVCQHEEVPSLRHKMADLTQIQDLRQLQYLKVSRYQEGQTFSKHTDAWPTEYAPISYGWVGAEDFFGDYQRPTKGCMSSRNLPLHNNFMTAFVYLNDVPEGGCTSFPNIGIHAGSNDNNNGQSFYQNPTPMDTRKRPDGSEWDWEYGETLRIHPQKGMAVLHFCSTLPQWGGICDGNTFHIAEPPAPGNEKFVCQQFFASCPEWEIPDDSMPVGQVSSDII